MATRLSQIIPTELAIPDKPLALLAASGPVSRMAPGPVKGPNPNPNPNPNRIPPWELQGTLADCGLGLNHLPIPILKPNSHFQNTQQAVQVLSTPPSGLDCCALTTQCAWANVRPPLSEAQMFRALSQNPHIFKVLHSQN